MVCWRTKFSDRTSFESKVTDLFTGYINTRLESFESQLEKVKSE